MKLFGLRGGMNGVDKLRSFSSPIRDFLAVALLARIDQTPQNKTQYYQHVLTSYFIHCTLYISPFFYIYRTQDPKP